MSTLLRQEPPAEPIDVLTIPCPGCEGDGRFGYDGDDWACPVCEETGEITETDDPLAAYRDAIAEGTSTAHCRVCGDQGTCTDCVNT